MKGKIKVGDTVKIKKRLDWPVPPGYKLAGSEGKVTLVREEGFVTVRLTKTSSELPKEVILRSENVDKI
jgi:hypothetical protein